MCLDFVSHLSGYAGARDDAKSLWHPVRRGKYLRDIILGFGERQVLAVDALDANGFAVLCVIITDAPDIAPEVAAGLTIPFERMPFVRSCVKSENKALELVPIKILKMNMVNCFRRMSHHSSPMNTWLKVAGRIASSSKAIACWAVSKARKCSRTLSRKDTIRFWTCSDGRCN